MPQELNISTQILEFKEAVRHAWNSYFIRIPQEVQVESFIYYEELEMSLFWALVVSPLKLNIDVNNFRQGPFDKIEVVVKEVHQEFSLKARTEDENGTVGWSDVHNLPSSKNQVFKFIDFFDWYPYGFIDLPYIRCLIERLPQQQNLEGNFALIATEYVDFIYKN